MTRTRFQVATDLGSGGGRTFGRASTMFRKHLIPRIIPIGGCAAAMLLCTATGSAKPKSGSACTVAFKGGQRAEQVGKLLEARDLLLTCANATCGALAKEC